MYTNNRDAYRQAFFIAWQKHQKKLPLDAVEAQLIEIMLLHTEYHALLEKPEVYQQQEFTLEENPFFHMSLHVAIREQIRNDRPSGIRFIHQQLSATIGDQHEAEHRMLGVLANTLWEAQQSGAMPDEAVYLGNLKALLS